MMTMVKFPYNVIKVLPILRFITKMSIRVQNELKLNTRQIQAV